MVAVSDTGVGMDDETRARIFLPFFTTKGVGRGTGLGLSMVHGVVKQSRGELFVHTAPGKGTTFKVCLPVSTEQPDVVTAAQKSARIKGTETVLLVEDEATVRELTRRVLMAGGYRVVVASSPAEALQLARDPAFKFQLVLTDVVMPSMDGPTLVQELVSLRQELRVLFMSGHTGGALVHQKVLDSQADFLAKPFVPSQLLDKVQDVLSKPARRHGLKRVFS